jgi:hypothetical protein
MERKKALIAAATIAGTLLAASTAYALTGGIVASTADGAGNLSPVTGAGPTDDVSGADSRVPATPSTSADQDRDDLPGDTHATESGDDDVFEHEDDGRHAPEPGEVEGREDDD